MKKVFVGLSGGVDSSVTAALLKEQGFAVVGVYMKNWTQDIGGVECPWRKDLADAQSVAAKLDIPFEIFDFENEYRERVVEYMIAEYEQGRTPNPDIMCNQEVKFRLFFDTAIEHGADMIATGHYARTADGKLYSALDKNKDQTYFLYRVNQTALERTLFPLGEIEKSQVRKLARAHSLPTASKPDSQGICFVGEVSIKDFLREYITTSPGPIVHVDGEEVGEHEGAALYTIGQRHGLNVGGTRRDRSGGGLPLYVVGKDMSRNIVYVSENLAALMSDRVKISQVHWINSQPKPEDVLYARSRHRGDLVAVDSIEEDGEGLGIHLKDSERALTAGQSIVLYRPSGDMLEVVGGGIITQ